MEKILRGGHQKICERGFTRTKSFTIISFSAARNKARRAARSLKTKQPIGVGVCEAEAVVSGGAEIEGTAVAGETWSVRRKLHLLLPS